jgi:GABA(A) receptor-associated protein
MGYKENSTLQERQAKSSIILQQYPDRIPIVIEPSKQKSFKTQYLLEKNKFITPNDFTVGQLMAMIRKKIQFPPEKALFLFFNDRFYPVSTLLSVIYHTHHDADGFLYATYSEENTFG